MKNKIIRVYLRFENDLDRAIDIFKKFGGSKVINEITNCHFYAYVYVNYTHLKGGRFLIQRHHLHNDFS